MAAETFRIEIPVQVDDQTEPGVGSATRKINGFDKTIQQTQERLDQMNRTRYEVAVEAFDKASSVIGRIGTSLKGIAGKAWRITMNVIDKATAPIRGVINVLKNPILQAGAVLGISVGLKDTIDTYTTFEATMSKVSAVSGATADQMKLLTAKAKEMGATTKFTASEAGDAFTYMAMAGWDAEQMLDGIGGIMALSSADGLDLATTSDIVTDALTAFGLKAKDSAHFADVLATASSSANTNVEMLGESFKYVAPVAGAMKYSVEDVSLALGLMANASVKGSMAGTSLKTALANMAAPTDKMAGVMDKYGISLTDTQGNMKTLRQVMDNIRRSMGSLSEAEQTAAASHLFGKEAMAGMLAIVNASEEDYQKLTDAIDNADGAAQDMSDTMLDNLAGSMTLLQSAADGVKLSIGERLKPHLQRFITWITAKMPEIEKAAGKVMDFVDEKIAWLTETINEFMSGEDWENADIWGKIKITWDKIVAEPFSNWWSSTGKQWFTEKAESIGESLGSGITQGLLALLGIDVKGATSDGKSIGGAFIQGFKDGFDTEQIGEALKTWANNNKEIVIGLGVILGGKLIAGIAKGVRKGKGLYDDLMHVFGKGSSNTTPGTSPVMPSAYTTTTMSVTAGVVNVYGNSLNHGNVPGTGGGGARPILLPGTGMTGRPLLSGGSNPTLSGGGNPLALPGAVSGGAAAGARLLTPLSNGSAVFGTGGSLTRGLATVGTSLGNASTMGGAATLGGASIAGGIMGLLGLGAGAIDLYNGSQIEDPKERKDKMFQGGTKIGMVGAGAGAGAAAGAAIGAVFGGVGAIPGALIGAGIGGVGALVGGDSVGKSLSDATDEGGNLTKFWEDTKRTASDVWDSIKNGASNAGSWISEQWNGFGEWFDSSVWTPIKDAGISAINIAVGAWDSAKESISEKWNEFSNWFNESVWTPAMDAAESAGRWVRDRWEEVRTWIGEKWSDFSGWFESTIWEPVKGAAQTASQWVSDRWKEARSWIGEKWSNFSGWFEESIWTPVKDRAQVVGAWLEDKFTVAKDAIHDAWKGVSGWFEKNVWNPIKDGASAAWEWVGEKLDGIGEWIGGKWTGFKEWLGELGQKGSKSTGLNTSQNKGSVLEHAQGGILTKPHMGIVAEDGPESIIPLEPGKRARGIDLWEQTGRNLGVLPYADGGITGDVEETETVPISSGVTSGNLFDIKIEVNPEFIIQSNEGMDEESIVAIIKARIKEMVDDIGDELAERLARIFSNIPVKGRL